MTRSNWRLRLSCLLALVCAVLAHGQTSGSAQAIEQIRKAWQDQDLKAVEAVAEQWLPLSAGAPEDRARVLWQAGSALVSQAPPDCKVLGVADRYIEGALADSDKLPVPLEMEIANWLQTYPRCPLLSDAAARRKKARLLAQAWRRFESSIDRNFDFQANRAYENVPPPPGIREPAFSGMDPKRIKDPRVRAEYEAAIAANRAKAERSLLQHQLRREEPRFLQTVKRFFVEAYTTKPYDNDELSRILGEVPDNSVRQEIISAVSRQTEEKQTEGKGRRERGAA